MASLNVVLKVKVAWWLQPYLYGMALACWATGGVPDAEKLKAKIAKAITVKASWQ